MDWLYNTRNYEARSTLDTLPSPPQRPPTSTLQPPIDHRHQRTLTFIEPSDYPSTGKIITFSILSALAFLSFLWCVRVGQTRSHYRSILSIRFLFPLANLFLCVENATLAAGRRFYNTEVDKNGWIRTVSVFQAFEVPILLVVTFEITYLIHKSRSVNFCGMYFDEGRRVSPSLITTPIRSFLLRNFIRALAIFLLVMGIIANFDILGDVAKNDELAGRGGWWAFFDDDRPMDERVHLLLSLIPAAVLVVCCLYFSFVLWRYGTSSSMVVHSSIANPWFSPMFGTLTLLGSQFFDENLFAITSNAGFQALIVSFLLLLREVDKDMVAADQLAAFLESVVRKGDAIGVSRMIGEKASAAMPGWEGGEGAVEVAGFPTEVSENLGESAGEEEEQQLEGEGLEEVEMTPIGNDALVSEQRATASGRSDEKISGQERRNIFQSMGRR